MTSAGSNYPGVTPPISLTPPTAEELERTDELHEFLKEMKVFENEEEARRRERVLSRLNMMVKEFVKRIGLAKNLPEIVAKEAGGKIFTFGSYRLGVHGAGADIDTLCCVPKYVTREDFFSDFYQALTKVPEISELTAVPDAYVPVIKMEFDGIPIDLVFARLALSRVPDSLELKDDNLLQSLDEQCVRSLNGTFQIYPCTQWKIINHLNRFSGNG
jgi:poly(A) polymerase